MSFISVPSEACKSPLKAFPVFACPVSSKIFLRPSYKKFYIFSKFYPQLGRQIFNGYPRSVIFSFCFCDHGQIPFVRLYCFNLRDCRALQSVFCRLVVLQVLYCSLFRLPFYLFVNSINYILCHAYTSFFRFFFISIFCTLWNS